MAPVHKEKSTVLPRQWPGSNFRRYYGYIGLVRLPHVPYTLDSRSLELFLFPNLYKFDVQKFNSSEKVIAYMEAYFADLQKRNFQAG